MGALGKNYATVSIILKLHQRIKQSNKKSQPSGGLGWLGGEKK